jgi:hypothetical protein
MQKNGGQTVRRYILMISAMIAIETTPLLAGTLIESNDDSGNRILVRIDSDIARIDSSDLKGYMLVDMSKQKLYAVNDAERLVIDMSIPANNQARPDKQGSTRLPEASPVFVDQGKGPVIKGFKTRHYKVLMDGAHCFDVYLSKRLARQADVRRFTEEMAAFSRASKDAGMIEYSTSDNPCETAQEKLDEQYLDLGSPLRTLDAQGNTIYEVKRIVLDTAFPAGQFTFPENYTLVTSAEVGHTPMESPLQDKNSGPHDNGHANMDQSIPEMSPER